MDVVQGSTLKGYIDGDIEGSASLVPGFHGNALYIDGKQGSRVAYGVHTDGCFFDPDQCSQGITFSFWLMLRERLSAYKLLFDNGGCWSKGVGYCLYVSSDDTIRMATKEENGYYVRVMPEPTINEWHFFITTAIKGDIKMFIDGCDSEPYSRAFANDRDEPHTEDYEFSIGDWASLPAGGTVAHFVLDELMVWYRVLDKEDVWNLYVQGGWL